MKTGDRFLGMHNTRFAEAQVICLEYGGAESETIQLIMFGQTICIYFFVMHNAERGILRGFVIQRQFSVARLGNKKNSVLTDILPVTGLKLQRKWKSYSIV